MTEELTLEKAIDRLKHQEAYQILVDEIQSMADGLLDELPDIHPEKLQSHAGRITTYREVLAILDPR